MLDSASTHAMIAVKDLGRAKEFYGGDAGAHGCRKRSARGWYPRRDPERDVVLGLPI